uniref:Polysaccharide deacetylase n=1 Tax=Solibacter usitatus (strain Ellin6076) TaxID=234267 RepID=Q02BK8_SOLUE
MGLSANFMRTIKRLVLLGLVLYLGLWAYRIASRKYYVWLPGYLRWSTTKEEAASGPIHLFFFFADHFEPGDNYHYMERWLKEYPALASRHQDSTGRPPQHTWFYPAEQPVDRNMAALQQLVSAGFGETELHLHHANDTQESARRRFERGIAYFQKFGFLKGPDGATHFAFVHGNWGLDNSNGAQFCGANRELEMLRQLGCFADFTFPSIQWQAQPPSVNSIYEATDDDRPRSYDQGVPLQAGVNPVGDLMIFQGPLLLVPSWRATLFIGIDDGNIHPAAPVGPDRVDTWIRSRIHVKGRPDWQFIKVHGHGAESEEDATESLGPRFDSALTRFEQRYNDGVRYVLHYVTAREAFNLVRAAADGKTGDPRLYYDYLIPRYAADPARRN